MRAAEHGSVQTVTLLLDAGAYPPARDQDGRTALDRARRYAGQNLAEVMLRETATGPASAYREDSRPFEVMHGTSPAGEATVSIGVGQGTGSGWVRKLCDGFDAVVALLERAETVHTAGPPRLGPASNLD